MVGHSGRAGALMDRLVLHCAPLILQGDQVVPGVSAPIAPAGGNGGNPYALMQCPAPQIAVGAIIRAGDAIDGFGLRCGRLSRAR